MQMKERFILDPISSKGDAIFPTFYIFLEISFQIVVLLERNNYRRTYGKYVWKVVIPAPLKLISTQGK